VLQRPQILRVGRGDVCGDETRKGVDLAQAGDVIVGRALVRRVEILADVDAENAAVARATDVFRQGVHAVVVEAQAVDQRFGFGQAEQARSRVARLGTRGHRSDLEEPESEGAEPVDVFAVLVQPRSKPDGIREIQAHDPHRHARRTSGGERSDAEPREDIEGVQAEAVRSLRVEREEQRPEGAVKHAPFYRDATGRLDQEVISSGASCRQVPSTKPSIG